MSDQIRANSAKSPSNPVSRTHNLEELLRRQFATRKLIHKGRGHDEMVEFLPRPSRARTQPIRSNLPVEEQEHVAQIEDDRFNHRLWRLRHRNLRNSPGFTIPCSVMMPVMNLAGVTSKAGFAARAPRGASGCARAIPRVHTTDESHLVFVAFFDGNVRASRALPVNRRSRRSNVKRNPVLVGEHRLLVRADLVRGVAIGRDADRRRRCTNPPRHVACRIRPHYRR